MHTIVQTHSPSGNSAAAVQLSLFDTGPSTPQSKETSPPPCNSTDTSAAAAGKTQPYFTERQQLALSLIEQRHGLTNDELSEITGWPVQSVTPVTNRLCNAGAIRDSEKRRNTRYGRAAIVWVAVDNGA